MFYKQKCIICVGIRNQIFLFILICYLTINGRERLSEMVVSSVLMMSSDNKFDKVCNFFHSKVASLKAALESKAIGLSHKIANEIALLVCIHTALQSFINSQVLL